MPRGSDLFQVWFGTRRLVRRWEYLVHGVILLALKFVGQATLVQVETGQPLSIGAFLEPVLGRSLLAWPAEPTRLEWLLLLWSVPFLWIGVSMSVRRAASMGISPLAGLLVLAPLIKIPFVFLLCVVSDRDTRLALRELVPGRVTRGALLRAALLGWAAGALAFGVSVLFRHSYGGVLFVLTPLATGFATGWMLNSRGFIGRGATAELAAAVMLVGLTFFLLVGFEGAVCLIMLAPLAVGLAAIGSLVGLSAALTSASPRQAASLLLVLPLLSLLEAQAPRSASPLIEVRSEILVQASPEAIWPHVVSFPELPPAEAWLFRVSLADPRRAVIDGAGVGAIRRCEFSTGPFIEPITAWEPPCRLAFDVTEQPRVMREISPWGDIAPPHLDGYLRVQRGEFRLERVNERWTRLVGTTWYELDVEPRIYWRVWTDSFIHEIHSKVLRHIAAQVQTR